MFDPALNEGLDKMAFRGLFKPGLFCDIIVEFVQKIGQRRTVVDIHVQNGQLYKGCMGIWKSVFMDGKGGQLPVLLYAKIDLCSIFCCHPPPPPKKNQGNEFCTKVVLVLLYKIVYLFLRGGVY